MTDDHIDAKFAEITSGDELSDLRGTVPAPGNRRGLLYQFSRLLLLVLAIAGVLIAVWIFVGIAVWAGEHGMLPAPN